MRLAQLLPLLLISWACPAIAEAEGAKVNSKSFWGLDVGRPKNLAKNLMRASKGLGFKPSIVPITVTFPKDGLENNIPLKPLQTIWQAGAIPYIIWRPETIIKGKRSKITVQQIEDGEFNLYIDAFATSLSNFGLPAIIGLAPEMNHQNAHWGASTINLSIQSPRIYKKLYRSIVNRVRRQKISTVIWAFSPRSISWPDPSTGYENNWNKITNYYPGDEYVDLFVLSGHNQGTTRTKAEDGWASEWQTFSDLFLNGYRKLRSLSRRIPIFVQTGTVSNGGSKSMWIKDAVTMANELEFEGIIWSQYRTKREDWRLNEDGTEVDIQIIPEQRDIHSWIARILRRRRSR